jgi:uncharacterized repeat protein (TIGR03837 family)
MLWDVFCRVIDNFGDIGVCWRLAVDLANRGQEVRLWVDDAEALTWMAPDVAWQWDPALGLTVGRGRSGVQVLRWIDAEKDFEALPGLQAGDVVVEAFGCDPPEAFISRMQRRASDGAPPHWINLEYLSAEDYVERSHGLRSPIWSGAGAGLHKHFFYPGFTEATGGLLREPGLIEQRSGELDTSAQRTAWLASLGVPVEPERRIVLVFCYGHAPLDALLDRLDASGTPCQVLVTPGPATKLAQAWLAARPAGIPPTHVALHTLPSLPQADFDRLLWCSDLNFVRGEDSAVRALWAGKPHVWQIYEQDDGVHADKLDAFMQRWMAGWPEDLRRDVTEWWRAWNGLGSMPSTLPTWHGTSAWAQASAASRASLLAQRDLCGQLIHFVTSSG